MTQSADDTPRDPFASFISGLDMDGVDGISCETVHPIIEDMVRKADEFDHWKDMVDRLEQQVSACAANEATDWLIEHAATLDEIELVTDAEGQVERIIMTPDFLAETFSDFADLVHVCDRAVRARLGDDAETRLPVAFLRQLLLLWRLLEHHRQQDSAAFTRILEHLMELVTEYKSLLRVYGIVLDDRGADAASGDTPVMGDDDGAL